MLFSTMLFSGVVSIDPFTAVVKSRRMVFINEKRNRRKSGVSFTVTTEFVLSYNLDKSPVLVCIILYMTSKDEWVYNFF